MRIYDTFNGRLCIAMFATYLLLGFGFPVHGGTISSVAFVNLVDGPNQNSSGTPNSSVSSTASGMGGTAFGGADTDIILRTFASSANSRLVNDAGGGAGFLSAFHILGNPDSVTLPLSFNFTISGSLTATSAAGNESSIASAGVQYDLQTSASRFLGGATLTSQAGIPTGATTGNLVGDVSLNGFTGITYSFGSSFSMNVNLSSTVDALSVTHLLSPPRGPARLPVRTLVILSCWIQCKRSAPAA